MLELLLHLHAQLCVQGGIGVIGGLHQNPKVLQKSIDEIRENLEDKNAPFGVDLLLPQVGGNARKTNVRLSHAFQLLWNLTDFLA